jgi:transcriptional regulator with XRE-family HTH domain
MGRKQVYDEKGIQAFAALLQKIRKEKGFTQRQLAFESGLSLSQIARIEKAKINPTLSTIILIARTLNVRLPDLLAIDISD